MRSFDNCKNIDDHVVSHRFIWIMPECIVVTSHQTITKSENKHTHKIEHQQLTLRTRMKRLARRTVCSSKSLLMHDIVWGLFVNRYEFALPI